jgi:predicted 3-demethylubiquinone-9 3-methyltransferase (glyoxalase superfamily)
MKQKITPCLWYNAQANEAATLYCSVFANAKITSQSQIVTAIDVAGQSITLLDGGPMYQPNPSISFYYVCETNDEIDRIWKAFTTEGEVMMELNKYPWSEKYGWLADKFGVSWQFALGKVGDVGQKITPCMMFTGKQYGRAEEAITFYSTVFKNSKVDGIMRWGNDQQPEQEGKVQHAQMNLGGTDYKVMLMESAGPHKFTFTEGVSLTIHCEDQKEIDYYWERLTESGEESRCGWLKDKFGVSWQIIPVMLGKLISNPKGAQAMMTMRKINIEQIVQATL